MSAHHANTWVEGHRRYISVDQDDYNLLMAKACVCAAWREWSVRSWDDANADDRALQAALADLEKMESVS